MSFHGKMNKTDLVLFYNGAVSDFVVYEVISAACT